MADKYSFIRVLRRSLKEREEQIQDILMSGGIKDMEKYNFLMGEISSISYIHDKIKEHLHDEGDIVDE
tara:strand:- start:128 stop:331 length:204 start_codon:yes stop_codon:yes gene_type:complete